MDLPLDFRELLEEFAREGVDHLIIGGYAVAFHARPRATKDLDLLLRGSPGNVANKEVAGRPQDLADVRLLRRVRTRLR